MSDVTATPEAPAIVIDPSNAKANNAPPAPESEEPKWLKPRLEQAKSFAREAVLKELGIESLDDGKKAIAALKASEEAKKTDAQKAADLESSLKSTKAEKEAMAEALSAFAQTQMSALTEAQRNAVVAVAGENPAKQLKTIAALTPTWAGTAAPAAQAQIARVADTAPPQSAPRDGGGIAAPPDLKAVHAELAKSNPVLAARFAEANRLFETK